MPYCKVCGNTRVFGASKAPPASQYANGPISGMIAEFNEQDEVLRLSSMGVNKPLITDAFHNPQAYFDICAGCGGEAVWADSAP